MVKALEYWAEASEDYTEKKTTPQFPGAVPIIIIIIVLFTFSNPESFTSYHIYAV